MLYLNLRNRCQTVIRALSVLTKISFIHLPLFFTYITVAGLKLFNQSRLRLTLCGMWISVYSTCVSIFTPTWLLFFKLWTSFSFLSVWGIVLSGKGSKSLLRVQERITYYIKICLAFAISIVSPLWSNGVLQAIERLSIVFTAYSNDGHVTLFALSISKLRSLYI